MCSVRARGAFLRFQVLVPRPAKHTETDPEKEVTNQVTEFGSQVLDTPSKGWMILAKMSSVGQGTALLTAAVCHKTVRKTSGHKPSHRIWAAKLHTKSLGIWVRSLVKAIAGNVRFVCVRDTCLKLRVLVAVPQARETYGK